APTGVSIPSLRVEPAMDTGMHKNI
ncbi:MAG: hypothetical protein QG608_2829, partial [Actinomycetota bacterium]|nr:hypothetical protein [Actinomycetota bacterium]